MITDGISRGNLVEYDIDMRVVVFWRDENNLIFGQVSYEDEDRGILNKRYGDESRDISEGYYIEMRVGLF